MKNIRCHYCGEGVTVENHVNLSLCASCKVKAGYDPVGFAQSQVQYVTTKREPVSHKRSEDISSNDGGMLLAVCAAAAMASSDSLSSEAFSGGESGGGGASGSF